MSNAIIGYGTIFAIGLGSPLAYSTIGEVFNISPAEKSIATVDVTHYESPNRYREFIAGLKEGGEWSMELHYVPAVSDTLEDYFDAAAALPCQVTMPNGIRIQFTGIVTNLGRAIPIEDKMSRTFTVKVSGGETRLASV